MFSKTAVTIPKMYTLHPTPTQRSGVVLCLLNSLTLTTCPNTKLLNKLKYERENDFIVENNEVGVMKDNKLHCQGLINLIDNRAEDGGFILVPGMLAVLNPLQH